MSKKMRRPVPSVRHTGGAIDEGVEALVHALNDSGYDTWTSCEGGTGHEYMTGYIVINEYLDKDDREDVSSIIGRYTDIPFRFEASRKRNLTWIKFLSPLSGRETWEDIVRKSRSGECTWEDLPEEWLPGRE